MFKYTLAFIKRKDEVLLINREKQPWKGSWNGVGGKVEINETPLENIIREIKEETGILVSENEVIDKGIVTWNTFGAMGNGLHVFLVDLEEDYEYQTPLKTDEGILDFKKIDWVCDYENYGLAHNIPYFIKDVLFSDIRYDHQCYFEGNRLVKVDKKVISNE